MIKFNLSLDHRANNTVGYTIYSHGNYKVAETSTEAEAIELVNDLRKFIQLKEK